MKKIAFVAVLIAVIVGIVFGGISLASAAPQATPTPTPTPTPGGGGGGGGGGGPILMPTCPPIPTPPRMPTPTPTPTPNCCVEMLNRINALSTQVTNLQTDLANVTRMETISGNYTFEGNTNTWYPVDYDYYGQVRHVSLSLYYDAFPQDVNAGGGMLDVFSYLGPFTGTVGEWSTWDGSPSDLYITLDFNTDYWSIGGYNDSANAFYMYYRATITYVPSP